MGSRLLSREQIRDARAQRCAGNLATLPGPAARQSPFRATWRVEQVVVDGKKLARLDGYASITGIDYEMWDMFGPYAETVSPDAFDETLAAGPDVSFLLNHRGMTMARTRPREGHEPTLVLDADPRGLHSLAYVNPARVDVADLLTAIDDGLITEMSFAFMITAGGWNDDYDHFTIEAVDLDRGDVSAVNYGANPYTSIDARAREVMADLQHLPDGAGRAALDVLTRRFGASPGLDLAAARARRAAGDTDADEDVNKLVASLDATLDEASALTADTVREGLPVEVGQALDLITAAEAIADQLMELLGIFDPDDAGDTGATGQPPRPHRGAITGTTYAGIGGDEVTIPAGATIEHVRGQLGGGGHSVSYVDQMLRL